MKKGKWLWVWRLLLLQIVLSCNGSEPSKKSQQSNKDAAVLKLDSGRVLLSLSPTDTLVFGRIGVENTGASPLRILEVIPDCGCTSADYTKTSILPGDTGSIAFEIFMRKNELSKATNLVVKSNESRVYQKVDVSVFRVAK